MNIFVIHSSSDRELIKKEFLPRIINSKLNVELLTLEGTNKIWKPEARRKINDSDIALYFLGKDSHLKKDTIDYELGRFIKANKKIYVIKLDDNNTINECLYRKPSFGNAEYINKETNMYCQIVSLDQFISVVKYNASIDLDAILGTTSSNVNNDYVIEQYKSYLTTSEDLVKRRQSYSSFYVTINSALVALFTTLIGLFTTLFKSYPIFLPISTLIFLSIGFVLCISWLNTITSYGRLNSAKMKVISAIEHYMLLNVYDAEWIIQSEKIGKKKYKSFTSIEKDIPKIFMLIYVIASIAAIIMFVVNIING